MSPLRAIGLMSGTSMDGIDAAYIETDGVRAITRGPALTVPYEAAFRAELKAFILTDPAKGSGADLEAALTDMHARAVQALLDRMGVSLREFGDSTERLAGV